MTTVTVTVPVSTDGKWHYFVAYSHPSGFGMVEMILDWQVTAMSRVKAIAEYIGKDLREFGGIVIVNYQLLSAPAAG